MTERYAHPGEMISPEAVGGFTQTGICKVVDMQSLEIDVDVNEAYVQRVHAGQTVEAVLDAYPDWPIAAHVIGVVPTANQQKATVKVRIAFDKLDPRILPQMGVQVRFMSAAGPVAAPVIRVPAAALRHENGADFVYVVEGGHAVRRDVGCARGRRQRSHCALGTRRRRTPDRVRGRPIEGRRGDSRTMTPAPSETKAMPNTDTAPLVRLRGVTKTFKRGSQRVEVLKHLDLDVPRGDFLALMGPSGSGKTTLLNILGGIDSPTEGEVVIDGMAFSAWAKAALTRWRARHVGFVFQLYHLLPVLTAEENVALPLLLTNLSSAERRRRARAALALVGLADRAGHKPGELSGGQEQRVGIARAIVTDPTLLLCDEPTGDLDRKAGDEVLHFSSAQHRAWQDHHHGHA